MTVLRDRDRQVELDWKVGEHLADGF